MRKVVIIACLLLCAVAIAPTTLASTSNGTIGTNFSSALLDNEAGVWSASTPNTQYLYWNAPEPYAVHVTDAELTGYLWGPGLGWVSLNCSNTNTCGSSNFKVTNDGAGTLNGYAWGEISGWISFSCANPETNNCSANGNARVAIGADGQLTGFAWSQNFGWIKFDCATNTTCVQTDWRPASQRLAAQSSGGVSGGSSVILGPLNVPAKPPETPQPPTQPVSPPPEKPATCEGAACIVPPKPIIDKQYFPTQTPETTDVYAHNENLNVKPTQSGLLDQDISGIGRVSVRIEKHSSDTAVRIFVQPDIATVEASAAKNSLPAGSIGTIFQVGAQTADGVAIHSFEHALLITLPIPEYLRRNHEIKIYSAESLDGVWTEIDPIKVTADSITIRTDRLAYFAIVGKTLVPSVSAKTGSFVSRLPVIVTIIAALAALCFLFMLLVRWRKRMLD